MENILTSVETTSMYYVADEIKHISINENAIKEMGEPFVYRKDQIWIFAYLNKEICGFICHNDDTIVYAYTLPEFRRKGVLKFLYNHLQDNNWKTVSSNMSLPFFLKEGFKIIKSFKNCHKLKK